MMRLSSIGSLRPGTLRIGMLTVMSAFGLLNTIAILAISQDRTGEFVEGTRGTSQNIISKKEWKEVEASIDKGLEFLSRQHRDNGSFQPSVKHDPGITGLCVMAFLSRGHIPGQGPYGDKLNKSVDFIMSCQQPNGLVSPQPGTPPNSHDVTPQILESVASAYNHSIGALVISEVFGLSRPANDARIRQVVERAIEFTSHRYSQPKLFPEDEGAWRYLHRFESSDSDLSVTSWNVLFLRSAKNAGFEVDIKLIEDASAYMKRSYDPNWKTFRYEIHNTNTQRNDNHSPGMAGAGILSLALSGEHNSELAHNAAKFILKNQSLAQNRNYFVIYPRYGDFYCSQAMFQMGGDYWSVFYPRLVKSLLQTQRADGSWITDKNYESTFGASYLTAMSIMALTPPYQMLPIFQR
jgi:hypothetical protein